MYIYICIIIRIRSWLPALKKRASSVLLVWVCTKAEEHQNHLSILSDGLPGAGEFPRPKNGKFNGVYDVSQKIKGDLYTYIYIYI